MNRGNKMKKTWIVFLISVVFVFAITWIFTVERKVPYDNKIHYTIENMKMFP